MEIFPPIGACILIMAAVLAAAASANFLTDVEITWGDGRAKMLENGNLVQLTMDRASGSGFRSKNQYLFGRLDMKIKLIAGNSAGTVTTYYLSSEGPAHDEVDFEFLGNVSGEPYVLHTNVFSQGKGDREQQFYLWFDPTADFHTYSVVWNPQEIVFYVDSTPIRVFKNNEAKGMPYPKNQAMRLYASLWNGETWATRGGLVRTDWSKAPFVTSYRSFTADACISSAASSADHEYQISSTSTLLQTAAAAAAPCSAAANGNWWGQTLDASGAQKMKWIQDKYMIYNYCTDAKRFPQGLPPPECHA